MMTVPAPVMRCVSYPSFRAARSVDEIRICREFAVQSGGIIQAVAGNPVDGTAWPSRSGFDQRLDQHREIDVAVVMMEDLSDAAVTREALS